ncbi:hypothetical protein ACFFWD_01535 [Bradyrhizobium erythrophlei]|uniref:hypothetical protein n=1 Tax=Bradyrhizobium erythrophlei TaxID=1437360 RepID=UPI0035EF498A
MGLAKFFVILIAVLLGAAFLYAGVGGVIPMLEYEGAKAYGVPIGIVFLVVAVLLAKFWVPTSRTTYTTEYEYRSGGDGSGDDIISKSKVTATIDRTFGKFEP